MIVLLTSGEYSDYSVGALIEKPDSLDLELAEKEFKERWFAPAPFSTPNSNVNVGSSEYQEYWERLRQWDNDQNKAVAERYVPKAVYEKDAEQFNGYYPYDDLFCYWLEAERLQKNRFHRN